MSTFKLAKNQKGMVSILVTMVIMIVVSLIVLGFAKIIRREERQSLDRQLSTQAFYAAESGINDAVKKISDDIKNNVTVPTKTSCDPDNHYTTSNQLDGTTITYSCLLIDPTPNTLEYSSINTTSAT